MPLPLLTAPVQADLEGHVLIEKHCLGFVGPKIHVFEGAQVFGEVDVAHDYGAQLDDNDVLAAHTTHRDVSNGLRVVDQVQQDLQIRHIESVSVGPRVIPKVSAYRGNVSIV